MLENVYYFSMNLVFNRITNLSVQSNEKYSCAFLIILFMAIKSQKSFFDIIFPTRLHKHMIGCPVNVFHISHCSHLP